AVARSVRRLSPIESGRAAHEIAGAGPSFGKARGGIAESRAGQAFQADCVAGAAARAVWILRSGFGAGPQLDRQAKRQDSRAAPRRILAAVGKLAAGGKPQERPEARRVLLEIDAGKGPGGVDVGAA